MKLCLKADPADRPTAEEIDIHVRMFDAERFNTGLLEKSMVRAGHLLNQTEDLLSQLFPKHIADALRDGRRVEPENHECVTVYFSDIVGYTEISSKLSPTKVSDLLHRLYSKFDHLCEEYHVFKVETVGDAYMCVTNLSTPQKNHARIMAQFSFAAVKATSETLVDEEDPSKGTVQIRV
jgi:class 3 adenylate cyclase